MSTLVLERAAESVGLRHKELLTLHGLIRQTTRYPTYPELMASHQELAERPGVHIEDLGHSSDYSDRRIEAVVIGDLKPDGATAYIEGPGHAPELVASASASVSERLFARHPDIFRRLGYDAVALSDSHDPDGMMLQRWPLSRPTVRGHAYRGYRGSARHQLAWGYPAGNFQSIRSEVAASLAALELLDPEYYGQLHGATFSSYNVMNRCDRAGGRQLGLILRDHNLSMAQEPESPTTRVWAPGVFEVSRKSEVDDTTMAEDTSDYGTTAADHIGPDTLMHIPEVAWVESDMRRFCPDTERLTRLGAITHRAQGICEDAMVIESCLEKLAPWCEERLHDPEIARLYDAARWWAFTIPSIYEGEVQVAQEQSNCQDPISPLQFTQMTGTFLANSAMCMGNTLQLARRAGMVGMQIRLAMAIEKRLWVIGPTRTIPVEQQVGAQVLAILTGMRYASLSR